MPPRPCQSFLAPLLLLLLASVSCILGLRLTPSGGVSTLSVLNPPLPPLSQLQSLHLEPRTGRGLGELERRRVRRSDDEAEEEVGPGVIGALTEVFNSFSDLATSLVKVKVEGSNSTEYDSGRSKSGRMTIPLIVGFKVSGAIVAALTALKVLVLKTIALSGLALIASVAVAIKYIMDKVKEQKHHEHHYEPAPAAYVYAAAPIPPHVQEVDWSGGGGAGYQIQTAHSDLQTAQAEPAASSGLGGDLSGHYSSQLFQTAPFNQSAYTYIPTLPVAQRKMLNGSPMTRTILKTIHRTSGS